MSMLIKLFLNKTFQPFLLSIFLYESNLLKRFFHFDVKRFRMKVHQQNEKKNYRKENHFYITNNVFVHLFLMQSYT